jgi:8-oxo-dGTP pyrophosphatase MutT (NUDIX family)
MKPGKIRPLAIGVFRHEGRILAAEGYDRVKRQTFYRPLGGKIEFGETGAQAVARELMEEIGAAVTDLRYLGTLENIFTYEGRAGHEIVLVYDGRLVDDTLYQRERITGVEGEDAFIVRWVTLTETSAPIYPDGLLDLLIRAP